MKYLLSTTALLTAFVASPSMAVTTSWDGSGANDAVSFSQFGAEGSTVMSGTSFVTDAGSTGTFSTSFGNAATRFDQGSYWTGNFANGATLLYDSGYDDLTFTFSKAVSAVGAQFQANLYGAFTAQINLSDGSYFYQNGNSTGSGDNSAIFIGAMSDSANITSITFHTDAPLYSNDFAISNISLVSPMSAVPEPATWAMMIGGIGLAGGMMRRQRRVSAKVAFA